MSTKKDGLLTIGEVARLSGVPVKTIRYYSDKGILPPSEITDAGYRLYSEEDCARLELILPEGRRVRPADHQGALARRVVG